MKHVTVTGTTFASDASSRPTARAGRQAINRIWAPFPVAYFTAAFATDLAYWRTAEVMWERFSIWLIVAGLILAGFAVIAFLIDLASGKQIERPIFPRVVGYALAVVLSVVNAFVHSRDGYTAVVPTGLVLSALVVVVLSMTAMIGKAFANRSRVGG